MFIAHFTKKQVDTIMILAFFYEHWRAQAFGMHKKYSVEAGKIVLRKSTLVSCIMNFHTVTQAQGMLIVQSLHGQNYCGLWLE